MKQARTVTTVTDRDTRQPRGFAFVEMTNAAEARDAIHTLDGSIHGGRALIVNEARPELDRSSERESPPGRDHRRHRI
jgi:cold-inducible RNA-binding protein